MKIIYFILFLVVVLSRQYAQDLNTSIAKWKNNAKGVYNIIHDDYGSDRVDGIWQYADTIASNRGIKFTIGAITSDCEELRNVNGYSTPYEYAKHVMINQHGHEIINHTHTHDCAVGRARWAGESPCNVSLGWGEDPNSVEFQQELVVSTNSIFNSTGYYPRFFIFPYDRHTNAANDKLKELGYIGSRTGFNIFNFVDNPPFYRNGYNNFDKSDFYPDDQGFFRTSVMVKVNNSTGLAYDFDLWAQYAIDKGVWVNRELHNVGDTDWGRVSVDDYRSHMNFLKNKMKSGELWVGTISEILTYQIQKLYYNAQATYDESDHYAKVKFSVSNELSVISSFEMKTYLSPLNFKSPITVNIDLSSYEGLEKVRVWQGCEPIKDYQIIDGILAVNVYPHKGDLTIRNIDGLTLYLDKKNELNKDEVVIFPNPSSSLFNLDMGYNKGVLVKYVYIYDSSGKLVTQVDGSRTYIGFGSGLPKGIYFFKVITDEGEVIKKIVKL